MHQTYPMNASLLNGIGINSASFSGMPFIRGLKASPGRTSKKAAGGTPVVLVSSIEGAVSMRLGNTTVELQLASWAPYDRQKAWLLPVCGPWSMTVHMEVRHADGRVSRFAVPVPGYRWWNWGAGYKYPPTENPISDAMPWWQDFAKDAGRWMTYDYVAEGSHTFYPATHEATGGPDGGGYIWTDYSRTRRDIPDANSFLVLINYAAWISPQPETGQYSNREIDLSPRSGKPCVARFRLLSSSEDMKGGSYHFWVLGPSGRVHKAVQPLRFGVGEWGPQQEVILDDVDQWQLTWGSRPSLTSIESFGISLLNAKEKPLDSCQLSMGPISIGA